MTDVAVGGSRRSHAAVVAAAAVALGLLAFAVDSVAGVVGQVLIALTSSGFGWGLAAFLAGRSAATAKRAVGGATALLVLATLLYFLLVLMVSRRWSGGTLEHVGRPARAAFSCHHDGAVADRRDESDPTGHLDQAWPGCGRTTSQ
ncbi:hypothetical protein ACIBOV_28085 [Micromonospora chersina]|uniref:hypothetical protein n=1 Tax=Micromonospora chersina TaxID=47854 RepID=UPI0037B47EFD